MHPVLAHFELIGGHAVVVGSYATFMTLAWIAMAAIGTALAASRGVAWRRGFAVFAGSLFAGVVGARLLDLVLAPAFYAENPARAFSLNFQGFSLYGGFVFGALAAIALARLLSLPLWTLADAAMPALAAGIVLMRTGCFLRGCCFGVPTALPWGVSFPTGSPAWTQQLASGGMGLLGMAGGALPVHPTQLYELAAAVLLCAAATLLRRREGTAEGVAFLAFALGFTVFRVADSFLRAAQSGPGAPAWLDPVMYSAIVAALVVLLGVRTGLGRPRWSRWPQRSLPAEPPPLPWEAVPAASAKRQPSHVPSRATSS